MSWWWVSKKLLYSRKFSYCANFRIFHMCLLYAKIKTTRIWTFEIFVTFKNNLDLHKTWQITCHSHRSHSPVIYVWATYSEIWHQLVLDHNRSSKGWCWKLIKLCPIRLVKCMGVVWQLCHTKLKCTKIKFYFKGYLVWYMKICTNKNFTLYGIKHRTQDSQRKSL